MLQAENISYCIGRKAILEGIHLSAAEGDTLGIVGPNGAGKTSLIRILAGLAVPDGGRVLLQGRDVHRLSERERARKVAYLSQNPAMGFGFTVWDVVAMGRYPYRGRLQPLTHGDRQAVQKAMELTGVVTLADRLVTELSGGERQRVFLARALAQEPQLLFLDEPTAHLDVGFQLEFLELMTRLRIEQGLAVVIALHDLTWAVRYCPHMLVLHEGQPAALGLAREVLTESLLGRVFGVRGRVVEQDGAAPRVDVAGRAEAAASTNGGAEADGTVDIRALAPAGHMQGKGHGAIDGP